VDQSVLNDLQARLGRTRLCETIPGVNFTYGFNSHALEQVIKHWMNEYNWREHETEMNQWNHFKTQIEGLNIHFLRMRPRLSPRAGVMTGIPLLMIHGWPGSFYQFFKMVPLLTRNMDGLAFELIIPSLPSYGFSDPSQKPGLHLLHMARILAKLMDRLNIKQYYMFGDDLGAGIGRWLSLMYPERVMGLHASFFYPTFVKLVCNISDVDQFEETGYAHMQSTKPDTIGAGLGDSPAGLAAHILEKYSTLTKRGNTHKPDGGLTESLNLDELLTNVMIYWVSNSATTAARVYKDTYDWEVENNIQMEKPVSPVTYGFALFPEEQVKPPKDFLLQVFPNLIQYTEMPRGGHFPWFEEPQLLADDIRSFVKLAMKRGNSGK
jgi:pimeloyl-ACP methyl ester carboxylesterase